MPEKGQFGRNSCRYPPLQGSRRVCLRKFGFVNPALCYPLTVPSTCTFSHSEPSPGSNVLNVPEPGDGLGLNSSDQILSRLIQKPFGQVIFHISHYSSMS